MDLAAFERLIEKIGRRESELTSRLNIDLKLLGEGVLNNLPPDESTLKDARHTQIRLEELEKVHQFMQEVQRTVAKKS